MRTRTPFDEKTAVIPYDRRLDVLKAKKLLNPPNVALFDVIFNWIDFRKAVRIGKERYYSGWTQLVSQQEIGNTIGASREWVSMRLKVFEDKGIIKIQRVGSLFRYRVRVYPDALKEKRELEKEPEKTEKEGVSKSNTVSNANSENISQRCENISQKCENISHIQEGPEIKTPLPPTDSHKKDQSKSETSSRKGFSKKGITSEMLAKFIETFSSEKPDNTQQRRWYGAMSKLVSKVDSDVRMVKQFPEDTDRFPKVRDVIGRSLRHYEQSSDPPQWPGYLLEMGYEVVSNFIALVIEREKPIERPEAKPELSEEERQEVQKNFKELRKELGFDDEVVIEEDTPTEPTESKTKSAQKLSVVLMPMIDTLAEQMDGRPHERIEQAKELIPDIVEQHTPGVVLRAIDIALFESGHKKPVNPNRKD